MKKNKGFSLIEMAIALIILGFILGGLIIPLRSQRDQQQIYRTVSSLEEVKDALLGFAVIHGRLPCSDKNGDGKENNKEVMTMIYDLINICESNNEGYLPWKDLGVGRYDAWGNPFRYRVGKEYTEIILSNKFFFDKDKIFVTGSDLRIRNREGDYFTTKPSSDSRVAAIIFSLGKNKVADDDNAVLDEIFVYDGYVENEKEPEKAFDDVLTWLSRNTLMNHLITGRNEETWP
jgi:prepilin-type N-terminal cleavage/methylation domain-containing protein